MKKIIVMILALVMLMSTAAMAETFKMGFDAAYPPYSYMDDNGEYTGYDIEMCQAVCAILGWDLELVPINWDTKLITLDAMEHDCIWSGMTLEVIPADKYTLSMAYSNNSQVILTKEGTGINTLADLAGKTVGVQLGTSADLMLQNEQAELAATFEGGAAVTFEDYNVCFTELMAGSIQAIAIDYPVAMNKIAEYGEEFYILEDVLASEQYGIAFRKDDVEMCEAVEGAFMQLVEDGTYKALAEKYGLDTAALILLPAEEPVAEEADAE